jgi:hypothetical protein
MFCPENPKKTVIPGKKATIYYDLLKTKRRLLWYATLAGIG